MRFSANSLMYFLYFYHRVFILVDWVCGFSFYFDVNMLAISVTCVDGN